MKERILLAQNGITNPVISGLQDKNQADAPGLFGSFFGAIVGVMLIAGAMWALMQLLRGGLEWVSSGGDQEKLQHAQGMLRDAIIGLVVLFAVWALFMLVAQWLGVGAQGADGGFQFKFPKLF